MPSISSLCCSSSDRPSKLEAETRHARIIAVTNYTSASSTRHLPQRWDYPLEENPPAYEDTVQQSLLVADEKQPIGFQLTVEAGNGTPPPPASPRSSVISIPSTRLTDLTAAQTGETVRTSWRESLALDRTSTSGSLPPYSYYARRSSSPASTGVVVGERERDAVWQHPVMASNWLEVLSQGSLPRNLRQRDDRQPTGENTTGAGYG
ncbi:hypothetical protein G647_01716 [Cladophialophora carrionii CBS 160.54]|uniref:Uncharacterized protein n=1 Tax=Cladophialophora carrionii CBS 160.54 TaxID=1279043 RepID=V9DSF0_9EURO|nr:uncharacterized protein G647_01716 [Cladophialophora carrionii CBS 160.54]ETI29263.1 hypothetical protein G647_01716 [Cladophialophora carrionii CBS 160.54]